MDKNSVDSAGKYAAILSMTEVGLGSILHAWKLPFSGHFLSLNQGFILCRSTQVQAEHTWPIPLKVSMIAAILKSLSPIGKRLTPMLAISVQGFLFSVGQAIFGSNTLGCIVSLCLLSLWAFAQPLLLYLLVFGRDIIDVANYFLGKLQPFFYIELQHLAYALIGIILFKLLLATGVAILALKASQQTCDNYFSKMTKSFKPPQTANKEVLYSFWQKIIIVGKDLAQPWFLSSLVLMGLFFYLNDLSRVQMLWVLLRPLAVAFIVFYCIRFLPFERFLYKIFGAEDSQNHLMLKRALSYFKGERNG